MSYGWYYLASPGSYCGSDMSLTWYYLQQYGRTLPKCEHLHKHGPTPNQLQKLVIQHNKNVPLQINVWFRHQEGTKITVSKETNLEAWKITFSKETNSSLWIDICEFDWKIVWICKYKNHSGKKKIPEFEITRKLFQHCFNIQVSD